MTESNGEHIVFERSLDENEIKELLSKITFRGLYDKDGNKVKPYKNARFQLVTVFPPSHPTSFPQVRHNLMSFPLFIAQPTIYKTHTDKLASVERFLQTIGKSIHTLEFEGVFSVPVWASIIISFFYFFSPVLIRK